MSEKIPGFNPNNKSSAPNGFSSSDLPPLKISPSIFRWRCELAIYSGMLLSASAALLPFILSSWYWPLVWLLFSVAVLFNIRRARLRLDESAKTISVCNKVWRLGDNQGEQIVEPFGEMLLWSWLIVLPLRNQTSKGHIFLVVFKDSMASEEWRKLRVWLRMCFREANN